MAASDDTRNTSPREADDPVWLMLGVGCEIWEQESGDAFIERLRAEEPDERPPAR